VHIAPSENNSFFPVSFYQYQKVVDTQVKWLECLVMQFIKDDAIELVTGVSKGASYVDACGYTPSLRQENSAPITQSFLVLLGFIFIMIASFNNESKRVWGLVLDTAKTFVFGANKNAVMPLDMSKGAAFANKGIISPITIVIEKMYAV
jgi:hypothetical protein